jgi:hypothetical protein
MKIAGEKVSLPPGDVAVFPRANGNLIFYIEPIQSWEPFDELHPRPKPPKILKRGNQIEDLEDPTFQKQIQAWGELRQNWLMIQALTHDKNELEWEHVKLDQPQTWSEVRRELTEAGLIETEQWYLIRKIYEVNALTEQALETARSNFLLMTSVGLNDG